MNVKFYLTRPKSDENTAVFARMFLDKKAIKFYTGISVNPNFWNNKKHRAKQSPAYRPGLSINTRLNDIKTTIEKTLYDYQNEYKAAPSLLTFRKLIDAALGKSKQTKYSFFEYFADFAERTKAGDRQTVKGKLIAGRTGLYYRRTLDLLQEFNPEMNFQNIDLDFYNDWLAWLRKKGFSENTIGAHVKRLKAVLNDATERGHNKNTAFHSKSFTVLKEDTDNIALTETDLQGLKNLDLSEREPLAGVRDLFLIGCYTGLRYSDFSRLTSQNVKGDFIEITQAKTGDPVVIPVHDTVKQILKNRGGILPKAISNQKTNEALKVICRQVTALQEITSKTGTKGGTRITRTYEKWEIISTHTARRTFATNAYLQGIPAITIMAITGHKTEKAFLKYIKVTPKEHAKIMAEHWNTNNLKIV